MKIENKIINVLKKGAICWDENYVSYVLSNEGELSNVINEKNRQTICYFY